MMTRMTTKARREVKAMPKFFRGVGMRGPVKPSVNIQRDFYTMATVNDDEAEIVMYGDIVAQKPVDWWTGEPVDGQFIIESEFLEDLKAVAGVKTLTIRMNSVGGDAEVAILIHNRLRELSAKGTKLVGIIDGVAMSGGSLIMCACDRVLANPSSIFMVHKAWTFLFGGYNADELRQTANATEAWDKSQVTIYQRKCKLSETVISHMMSATTYMTGKEAVEKGFADELLTDAEPLDIAASADGLNLFVRGRKMHMAPGMALPDSIPTVEAGAKLPVQTNTNQPVPTGKQEGGSIMAKTLEELRKEDPELANQLMAEAQASATANAGTAAEAERRRIQEIDAISALYDDETVRAAKYGEHACTAQEMTYRAAQAAAKQGKKFLGDLQADAKESGAAQVAAAPAADEDKPMTPAQRMAQGRADAKKMQGKEEK